MEILIKVLVKRILGKIEIEVKVINIVMIDKGV